jgi:hypothetical protein
MKIMVNAAPNKHIDSVRIENIEGEIFSLPGAAKFGGSVIHFSMNLASGKDKTRRGYQAIEIMRFVWPLSRFQKAKRGALPTLLGRNNPSAPGLAGGE